MNTPAREDEIFEKASQLSGAERQACLEAAAGPDAQLRKRLQGLLEAHDAAGTFLNNPAAGNASTLLITTNVLPISEKPGDKIGHYKLREKIGEGGCGVVYIADQEEPVRRRVALKIIKLGMDTREVVARFEAERQALALMDHQNIAKVLDAGATETGRPYFVMELVRGTKITDYCDQNNLSTEERLKLFVQVCQAIQHAHQKGIIHRDIKPSNILVTLHDGVPVPKVIDFGIAKATTNQRLTDKTIYTAFEQFIGTPAYMSPEQAEMSGLDIDTRTDIYSLGVLLYELLIGKTPFDAATLLKAGLDQMRKIIREQEPPRPSTRLTTMVDVDLSTVAAHRRADPPRLVSLIRGDLDWIVMLALEKDRSRRYETANSFAQDILRHLNSEPVVARPASPLYKFQKFARRNTLPLAAAAVVAAALIVGLGISLWSLNRERNARQGEAAMRRQAETSEQKALAEGKRADAQAAEARAALAASDFHQAVRLLSEGRDDSALAYLVRSLKNNLTNEAAADRLSTLLASRCWYLPLFALPGVDLAEFSPDGRRIVTTSRDFTVRVWDAQTGQALSEPLMHSERVIEARFSPDGKHVMTASSDTARVWDVEAAKPVTEPLAHSGRVSSVRFNPDGRWVITASKDHTAKVWGARTGWSLVKSLQHPAAVRCAEFSPQGERVVTVCEDRTARLWDLQTGKELTEPLSDQGVHDFDIMCSAQFTPEGKHVVTVTREGYARFWDAFTGQPLSKPFEELGDFCATFFHPSEWIVFSSADRAARLKNVNFQGVGISMQAFEHRDMVWDAQFSPDRKWVIGEPGNLYGRPIDVYDRHPKSDGAPRVWNARTRQPLTRPLKHKSSVSSVRFGGDGKRVMTVSERTALIWALVLPPKVTPGQLILLAEAVSSETLDSRGMLETSTLTQDKAVKEILRSINQEPDDSDWMAWSRWVVAAPSERTLSPFSEAKFTEYLEREIAEGSLEELEEIESIAVRNQELLQKIAAARLRLEAIEQANKLHEQSQQLEGQGNLQEAEALCRQALALREENLAVEHIAVASTLATLGRILSGEGKLAEAEGALRKALRKLVVDYEEYEGTLCNTVHALAHLLRQQGKSSEAEATYERMLSVPSSWVLRNLALDLASSPDSRLRSGRIALLLAEKAVALEKTKSYYTLGSLAAAYAENGDFEKAVKIQKQVMTLSPEGNWEEETGRLRLYESGTPFRRRE